MVKYSQLLKQMKGEDLVFRIQGRITGNRIRVTEAWTACPGMFSPGPLVTADKECLEFKYSGMFYYLSIFSPGSLVARNRILQ